MNELEIEYNAILDAFDKMSARIEGLIENKKNIQREASERAEKIDNEIAAIKATADALKPAMALMQKLMGAVGAAQKSIESAVSVEDVKASIEYLYDRSKEGALTEDDFKSAKMQCGIEEEIQTE